MNRIFPPLPADHPAVRDKEPCAVCGKPFKPGDETRFVNLVPDDAENRAKAAAGRPYRAVGQLAHSNCFVKGDRVAITHDGRTVPGVVLLVDKYGKAGAVGFEAILGGYVGMMPVFTAADGIQQTDLIKGQPVEIKPANPVTIDPSLE